MTHNMRSIRLKSPAKLNLVLDVVGKRADGFHELRTVFERIDLADMITLTLRQDSQIKVICVNPQVPKGSANLAVKAAVLLRNDFNVAQGVTIKIDKKIPVAAGLGGGSSNAATVLMGLNRLWQLGLSQNQLGVYAAQLGSDLNFFIYNTAYALGTGRGEKIKILPVKAKLWHVLVTPRVKMLTKDVFKRLAKLRAGDKITLTKNKDNVSILLPFLRENKPSSVGSALANDLEEAILSLRPDFAVLKKKLKDAGACGVGFSGSGPSVFALASSKKHAEEIKARLDKRYKQVFVVKTF